MIEGGRGSLARRLVGIGLCVLTVAACETAGPIAPISPVPESPGSATSSADACPVAITLTIAGTGLRREVVVTAENRSTGVQELVLPDRCPNGPVEFSGLPAGYDYYNTCAMGACPGERAPTRLGLGRGEGRELVRTTLELGDSSCNSQVPAGEYRLSASVPGVEPACVGSVVLVVDAAEPESMPASADIDFQACTADSDCIVHCPRAEGCCGWPCGCQNAINKAHVAAFDAHHARTCEKAPNCPAMGCAYEPHHFARCVNNRCRSFAGL